MSFNQLTQQEQVLISAFRNLRPEKKGMLVDMTTDLAKAELRNGPKLSLVAGGVLPRLNALGGGAR